MLEIGAVLLAIFFIGAISVRYVVQRRMRELTRIKGDAGICSLVRVQFGDTRQWLLIRGKDRTNPVLLVVHGGPGFPEMPFAQENGQLEEKFVVVHWDHRGAGKSFRLFGRKPALSIDVMVEDIRKVVAWLRQRLQIEKVYLVAHSWGTVPAILAGYRYPDLFWAYIGVAQIANLMASERQRYQYAFTKAQEQGNRAALADLRRVGGSAYTTYRQFMILDRWVRRFSGKEFDPVSPLKFLQLAFSSPVYSWIDMVKLPLGFLSWVLEFFRQRFYDIDLFVRVPKLLIPVYFFQGRYDHLLSPGVAEQYFKNLEAPSGKRFVSFENSGHWPQFEQAKKYREEIQSVLLAQKRLVKINSTSEISEAVTDIASKANLSPNANRCIAREGNN
jgi:pimeloyl-ACP methyl ester carboxylesterase